MNDIVYTKEDVVRIAKTILGKTFGEINNHKSKTNSFNKGELGHILEEDVYHYGKNSDSSPDFIEAGIELKVTPYRINKNGSLSAKERLVLNVINYMEEYKNSFYTSHFWYKNKLIQILWYLHEEGKEKKDYRITDELLFSFPDDDLPVIIQDWNIIVDKIKSGKAHEISEADTMYLGACTKGTSSNTMRKQPFSDELAKQRAFCLKQSYMTEIVRQHIGGAKPEKLVKNNDLEVVSFENYIYNTVNPYIGKSQRQLMQMFDLKSEAKNINELLICKMFGIKSDLKNTEEFIKSNIVPRSIRVQFNGTIKESLPFPAFDYIQLVKEEWENSELRNMFSTTKFLFFIFKEVRGEYIFHGSKLWNMPLNLLDSYVKDVWKKTQDVIMNGNIVAYTTSNGIRKTNFPGMKDNYICHVRPHGRDKNDCSVLPVIDRETGAKEYTKHAFWINSSFLVKIINGDIT